MSSSLYILYVPWVGGSLDGLLPILAPRPRVRRRRPLPASPLGPVPALGQRHRHNPLLHRSPAANTERDKSQISSDLCFAALISRFPYQRSSSRSRARILLLSVQARVRDATHESRPYLRLAGGSGDDGEAGRSRSRLFSPAAPAARGDSASASAPAAGSGSSGDSARGESELQ